MRILGVDPGTAVTGYGVIDSAGNRHTLVEYGTIKTKASDPLPLRLNQLFEGLKAVIAAHKPDEVAIESIFYSENVKTALVLGHTRGVLILAGTTNNLPVYEYSPREVKQSVVGRGNASKEQVQFMIKNILGLTDIPKPNDAADGCALAICHVHQRRFQNRLKGSR